MQNGYNINGTWTLESIDNNTSAPPPRRLSITGRSTWHGPEPDINVVAVTPNFGVTNAPLGGTVVAGPSANTVLPTYPTTVPSSPISIGPGLVMATDNTLGSFSPYEGRIYAAFVGYYNVTVDGFKNPAANTDIFLIVLRRRRPKLEQPVQVNDDDSQTDGYTGSNDDPGSGQVDGRSQYMPEIAVDPTTGTVVLSWRDARDDAANARVATYITTSIDGGKPSAPRLTPIRPRPPSTRSRARPRSSGRCPITSRRATTRRTPPYGYGDQMGLAVYDGQLYPIWAGNFNEGTIVNGAVSQGPLLQIYYQPMVIAAGPRIISSTHGADHQLLRYPHKSAGQPDQLHRHLRPADRSDLSRIRRDFHRGRCPCLLSRHHQRRSLHPAAWCLSVTPVLSSGVGPDSKFGYTEFTVTFDPTTQPDGAPSSITNFTGTYSYAVLPDANGTPIVEPIRSFVTTPVDPARDRPRRRRRTFPSAFPRQAPAARARPTISRPRRSRSPTPITTMRPSPRPLTRYHRQYDARPSARWRPDHHSLPPPTAP